MIKVWWRIYGENGQEWTAGVFRLLGLVLVFLHNKKIVNLFAKNNSRSL